MTREHKKGTEHVRIVKKYISTRQVREEKIHSNRLKIMVVNLNVLLSEKDGLDCSL